jgi:hypothetical protein
MVERARALGAPARLAAFVLGLALIGGVAALVGTAAGSGRPAGADGAGDSMAMEDMSPADRIRANGLATVAAGYSLAPERSTLPAGRTTEFRFRILDDRGQPVRRVDVDGGVRVHLIVVRRDFAGYQHLHPALHRDGSWAVPLRLAAPGAYRAFADFEVDGRKTVLGHDLFVPGDFTPAAVPAASTHASRDGFAVELTHEPLHANDATRLRFVISRDGRPVQRFDPYVGHRGHLVALRDGDLSYSHVHPEPDARVGEIVFHTELPSAGRYRLFLQFKVAGTVHTVPFTVEVQR